MLRNVLMIIALVFTFIGDASAQSVGQPASQGQAASTPICQAGNRNWSCGIQGTTPSGGPVTVCLEEVTNGVVTRKGRDMTFASATALAAFRQINPNFVACGTTPSCTPNTQTRTQACPTGQIGLITEQRTTCVGGNPNTNTEWTVISNTCTQTCTENFENRDVQCPAGYTGKIVERRITNVGGVCNVNGNWTQISNTCTQTCTESTETSTTRRQCPAGYTGVITDRRTINVGGTCGVNSSWTEVSNTCTQVCLETCSSETTPCGAGYTGNQTRKVTTNTGGVCGNTTYDAWDRSQCVPVCTQSYTQNTQACPAGQAGNGIVTRTYTNYLGQCGNTVTVEVSRDCHQVCTPSTSLETAPCGAGYTGNQTRTVTVNTNGTCGNTTYSTWNRSQCVPVCTQTTETRTRACPANCHTGGLITEQRTVNTNGVCGAYGNWVETSNTCTTMCTPGTETQTLQCPAGQTGAITQTRTTNVGGYCGTYGNWVTTSNTCHTVCNQSYTDSTQQCPAGETGTGIVTRTFTNYGNQCGATYTQEVSRDCTPMQYLAPINCTYCTDSKGSLGLEYNKEDPNYVYLVFVGANNQGQMGANCGKLAPTDPIPGRHRLARIPLASVSQNTFSMTLNFKASVSGATCSTVGATVNGFKMFSLTLNVDRAHSSTTYIDHAFQSDMGLLGEQAVQAVLSGVAGTTGYIDVNNAGLFSQCGGNGAKPNYSIYVGSTATVQ